MTLRSALDRVRAAQLLRVARAERRDPTSEAIDWAFTALPESRGARRLKIETLLAQGDFEAADVLLAQGLLHRPTSSALSLLRAKSFHARGETGAAGRELRLVLAQRPHHREALELAGRTALQRGDAGSAVELLEKAERRRPLEQTKGLLVEAWLAAARPDRAETVLLSMIAPSPVLRTRVLRAQGRLLEAIETLEEARRDESHPEHTTILCTLIDLLEETANTTRLSRILDSLGTRPPRILARAGAAWLSMGAFQMAIVRMRRLAHVPGFRERALVVLMVAASMLNRKTLANRALRRLRRSTRPVDRALVADAWCRGLLGRLLVDQRSARKAGADPHTGRLRRLLGDAAEVFAEELASDAPLPRSEQTRLRRQLTICGRFAADAEEETAEPPSLAA